MQIKRNYNLILDKEKDKADAKLRIRIKWNSNKDIISLNVGYRVDPLKWSAESGRCINNTTHGAKKVSASIINRQIQKFIDDADRVFIRYEASELLPTKEQFKKELANIQGKTVKVQTPDETILGVFDKFTKEVGRTNDWTEATFQKMRALRIKIDTFQPADFSAFNEDGLNNYVLFLRDSYELRNSTIEKQVGFLKWFLKWAFLKGYSTESAYQSFNPKLKKSEKRVIFLTWKELITVYNFDFSDKPHLDRVRDAFCFCCFTSLRYSDLANLRRSDIYENHIEVTTIKTADNLRIELNKYSRAILEKYADIEFPKNLALPVLSNQKMNEYLKDVGELCEIDDPIRETYYIGNKRFDNVFKKHELLGTHAGRRTFICNALALGIPANVVMKWTGHSDYKAMRPYIDIENKAKQEAMKLFDNN